MELGIWKYEDGELVNDRINICVVDVHDTPIGIPNNNIFNN